MDNVGSLEGKYEVLEKLHEGGMGAIYKVRHRLLDEVRVIKVMRSQHEANESLRTRFLREAQMAVKLRHPHIAQMYDFAFDESGRGFIVMEYVDGVSLQQMLERVGTPSLGLALDLARQALTALAFLHRKGIVHRDISPDNIMATRDDLGKPLVKLIDLGIAKVVTSKTNLTVSGTFLGKLLYASPEQFGAQGSRVDQRSDVYSFGVVLYELFTGNHPFPGTSPQELIAGHLVKPPLDFAQGDPSARVPQDLREAVLKAIAKKPDERFASAEDLDRVLAAVQARFPLDPQEFERVLRAPDAPPAAPVRPPAPGSTQDHINAQFGMGSTPQPILLVEPQDSRSTAPTLLFPADGTAATSTMPKPGAATAAASPHATQPAVVLPPSWQAPQQPPAEPAPDTAAPVQPTDAAPTPRRPAGKRPPWLVVGAAGAAAVLVLAVVAGRGLLRRPGPASDAPAPAETPAAVAPPTSPAGAAALNSASPADLESALAGGSVEKIRTLLAALSNEQRAANEASPGGRQRLDLARRCVQADDALAKAVKGKEWESAVVRASGLLTLLPSARAVQQTREDAAAALEAEAESLARKGQTDAALARLQALQAAWPGRAGLEARLARMRAAREADQRFVAALAAADTAEKERSPEKGLEALAQVKPDPRWQERLAGARARLEAMLAEIDKEPPTVRLKPGLKTDYSKGKALTVALVVTDDYRVKSVTVMARREGAPAFQELPATSAGNDEYSVEITPEFHGNKTVELFVLALDYAGHRAWLGSAEQPLRFKKRWLF